MHASVCSERVDATGMIAARSVETVVHPVARRAGKVWRQERSERRVGGHPGKPVAATVELPLWLRKSFLNRQDRRWRLFKKKRFRNALHDHSVEKVSLSDLLESS